MKFSSLALAAVLFAGPALAQVTNPPGVVSTAPTPSAPSGVTVDQGAGAQGMAASPAAPAPVVTSPPGGNAGTQGQQPAGQQGGSSSGS